MVLNWIFFENNYKSWTILLVSRGLELIWYLTTRVYNTRFYCSKLTLIDSISMRCHYSSSSSFVLFFFFSFSISGPVHHLLPFFQAPQNPSQFFLLHLNPFLKIPNPKITVSSCVFLGFCVGSWAALLWFLGFCVGVFWVALLLVSSCLAFSGFLPSVSFLLLNLMEIESVKVDLL